MHPLATCVQLTLALVVVATATPVGVTAGVLAIALLAARHAVRRRLGAPAPVVAVPVLSAAVGAGVLAAPQGPGVLGATGTARQGLAGGHEDRT